MKVKIVSRSSVCSNTKSDDDDSMTGSVRTSSLLQVQLSIQSGLGLSLQAGPSVTGFLGSDVAK